MHDVKKDKHQDMDYNRSTIQQYVDGGFATHQLDINEVEGIIRPLQREETLKKPTGVKSSES